LVFVVGCVGVRVWLCGRLVRVTKKKIPKPDTPK